MKQGLVQTELWPSDLGRPERPKKPQVTLYRLGRTVYNYQVRKCGKTNCRCAHDPEARHGGWIRYDSHLGTRRRVRLTPEDLGRLSIACFPAVLCRSCWPLDLAAWVGGAQQGSCALCGETFHT